jgi:methionyl-tRNA synthetase
MADVMRRYYRARGTAATFVCLMDEHQSYVLDRAHAEGTTADAIAAHYSDLNAQTLAQFHATPDECVYPARDEAYRSAVQARFAQLVRDRKIEAREVATLFCAGCDLHLYDSFVLGKCPHCSAECFGFICDVCCKPNQTADLVDATCDRCEQPASRRTEQRLVFPIAPYQAALGEFHRSVRATPKLRGLAAKWLAELDVVPASQVSTWGIPVGIDGFDGHVISPWLEVALAATYLKERYAPGYGELLQLFGYDNAFLYLIHDPAVSLALDPSAPLPRRLVANEFLLFDDVKMSKSRSHALRASDVLAKVPADLLRLYLAKLRPEEARTSCSLVAGQMYLTVITQLWQRWLARLGDNLAAETASRAPAPAPSSTWSVEHTELLGQLESLLGRARRGYETSSLKEVMIVVHELVERASAFGVMQTPLAGIASLEGQRMTGLALELAALRTFAIVVAPIMPVFAQQLWTCLGYEGPVIWDDAVAPVDAGQPIATATLGARQFFPSEVNLV